MPLIESRIDPTSDEFATNADALRVQVDDLREQLDQVLLGGGDDARLKHLKREKMLPRDRVAGLLDADSPFLELSALAAHVAAAEEGDAPAFSRVSDRPVLP